jgi:hypothetical protein
MMEGSGSMSNFHVLFSETTECISIKYGTEIYNKRLKVNYIFDDIISILAHLHMMFKLDRVSFSQTTDYRTENRRNGTRFKYIFL